MILLIIFINTCFLASEHYQMSDTWIDVLRITDYLFGSIYLVEAAMKIIALGHRYFLSYRNLFDFFIVITIIIVWAFGANENAQTFSVFESLRVYAPNLFFPQRKQSEKLIHVCHTGCGCFAWLC